MDRSDPGRRGALVLLALLNESYVGHGSRLGDFAAAEEAYARLSDSPELAEAIARFRDRKGPAGAPGG